ncbi:MAG TPA: hypothetical protein DCY94_04430 [Firmicutes bacterium]|nr:hypothetical protein [Bacillota bacterium]
MENFTVEEKRKFMFKKHLKYHTFEYILDIIMPSILTLILLYICKAEKILYGIIVSLVYSIGKVLYSIYHYKKEYIDIDIKEEKDEK